VTDSGLQPVLVTGFDAFGPWQENSSAAVATALASEPDIRAEVLPVAYARAEERLTGLLSEVAPRAVLMLGVHPGDEIRLERVALNLDEQGEADVDGAVRRGERIRGEAPVAYWSTLPLREMAAALDALGLRWSWSSHAGGFLCNHVFYVARHELNERRSADPCGFVHLPSFATIPFEAQLIAVRACVDALFAASNDAS